jgi:sulfur relay (sulfurtransferase) DsrF/TusC family protein
MKHKIKSPKRQIANAVAIFLMSLIASSFNACNTIEGNPANSEIQKQQSLILVADDESISTKSFPRLDTSLIRELCEALGNTGGTVVVYKVGNPSDQSGFRCTLQPVPDINTDVIMEKQVEEKQATEKIRQQNNEAIEKLINDVQRFVFNDSLRETNTDLNGFFSKADVLLNEPQYRNYKRFVFVISDGVQSINNHDKPSVCNFKNTDFNLCLCGWKTSLPDTMEVMQFESPKGFSEFINHSLISKN